MLSGPTASRRDTGGHVTSGLRHVTSVTLLAAGRGRGGSAHLPRESAAGGEAVARFRGENGSNGDAPPPPESFLRTATVTATVTAMVTAMGTVI